MTNTMITSRCASLLLYFILFFCQWAYTQVVPIERLVNWNYAGLNDTTTLDFTWINVVDEGLDHTGTLSNDTKMDSLQNVFGSNGVIFFFPQG